MVAASPCALAVAPLAYATAISACAKKVVADSNLALGCGLKAFFLAEFKAVIICVTIICFDFMHQLQMNSQL